MKKVSKIIFIFLLSIGFSFTQLQAGISLASKIAYLEKLKKEAILLEEQGYYNESIKKSREIKALGDEVGLLVEIVKKWYQLERNIAVAKQINADQVAPEEYNKAIEYYKSAEKAFVDEDIDQADYDIDEGLWYIDIAIEKAREYFDKNNKANKELATTTHKLELTKMDDKYYVVRLIPERRDSLWRIAEYNFVYGDPWKWKRIYEANKDIINDPDLIYPNQKLVIPPLEIDLDK